MICLFHIALPKYMAYAPYELPSYRYWSVTRLGRQYAFYSHELVSGQKAIG